MQTFLSFESSNDDQLIESSENELASAGNNLTSLGGLPLPEPPTPAELEGLPMSPEGALQSGEAPPPPNHQIEMWSGERKSLVEIPASSGR